MRTKEVKVWVNTIIEAADDIKRRCALCNFDIKQALKGKKMLDAGCGSGYSALLLFDDALNDCSYVGVDISKAVDEGKALFWFQRIRT